MWGTGWAQAGEGGAQGRGCHSGPCGAAELGTVGSQQGTRLMPAQGDFLSLLGWVCYLLSSFLLPDSINQGYTQLSSTLDSSQWITPASVGLPPTQEAQVHSSAPSPPASRPRNKQLGPVCPQFSVLVSPVMVHAIGWGDPSPGCIIAQRINSCSDW